MIAQPAFDPARRGYYVMYREGEVNHCPGCDNTHWLVGRMLAECAFCATALPLEASLQRQATASIVRRGSAPEPWPKPSCEQVRTVKRGGGGSGF